MSKISKSELLAALSATEEPGGARAHGVHRGVQRPGRSAHPEMQKLFAAFARDAKLDLDKLANVRSRDAAELQRLHKVAKADAVKASGKVKKVLAAGLAGRVAALEQLGHLGGPLLVPTLITLDKPFLIWATPHSNIIYDSGVAPSNNWAKIKIDSSAGGQDKLSFYFLWENPSEYYAAINATTSLVLNGFCSAHANGSISYLWNVGGNTSSVYVSAILNPWQWWNQPPTLMRSDTETVASFSANAGFFDDDAAQNISGIFDLAANGLVLPPNGVMVFEVALSVFYGIDDGDIEADFNDGSFNIVCPSVAVSLLTAPSTVAVA